MAILEGNVDSLSSMLDKFIESRPTSEEDPPAALVLDGYLQLTPSAAAELRNRVGINPFIVATQKGWTSVVHLLHQRGFPAHWKVSGGSTALMFAAAAGHLSMVSLLLDMKEIEVDAISDDGFTGS
jgi:ankyrin repeat protein